MVMENGNLLLETAKGEVELVEADVTLLKDGS